jgi:hypothetical protein
MFIASPATIAAPATDNRVDDDILTRLQPSHVRSHRRDRTGRFVPEHNGIPNAGMMAQIHIEIGVTNRGGGDAHDHLARFGSRNGAVGHGEPSGLFENCYLHCTAPHRPSDDPTAHPQPSISSINRASKDQ